MQEDEGMTDRKGRWTDEMEEKVGMREMNKGKEICIYNGFKFELK